MFPVVALVPLVAAFVLAIARVDGAPMAGLAALALAALSASPRWRGLLATRFLGVCVAYAALGATRFAPLVGADGSEGAGFLTRLVLWYAALACLGVSRVPPARAMRRGLAALGVFASLACGRSCARGAMAPEEQLAALPSILLAEQGDHRGIPPSRTVTADGRAIRLATTYGAPQVCDVGMNRCTESPLWGTGLSGPVALTSRDTVVRLTRTPRLWILTSDTPRGHLMTSALDRATMASVPLRAADLPRFVAAPSLWTYQALVGIALALGLTFLAAARAHSSRWMRATLPGTLAAGGVLTVLDHTTTFVGLVPPGPVAVRAITLKGGVYRSRVVAGDVIEGTPADAAARWYAALTADLACAGAVALVAGAPLVGAALVGVSAAAL